MEFLGLSVEVTSGRAKVCAVRADLAEDALLPICTVVFPFLGSLQEDQAQQLASLLDAFQTYMAHESYEGVCVRTADYGPGSTDTTLFARHSAEGLLMAVAKHYSPHVIRIRGRDLARRFGTVKADMDAAAALLCPGQSNATSAALAALVLRAQ